MALLLALNVLGLSAPQAFAHGAGGRILSGNAVIAEFRFADGSPMAFADVKVHAPSRELWLGGRTDGAGKFAFVPDNPGEWTLEARDAEDHTARLVVTVGAGDLGAAAVIHRYWGYALLASFALNLLLLMTPLGRRSLGAAWRRAGR
jgi:nickel transport protein